MKNVEMAVDGNILTIKVDLTKDFIGSAVLKRVKASGPKRKVTGFEVEGKRIARPGTTIHRDGRQVGTITSGVRNTSFWNTRVGPYHANQARKLCEL